MASGFKSINFGWASAETESTRTPELLTSGYVDIAQAAQKAVSGHEFLFLGYKGSGKTAIGRRISLMSEADHATFCTNVLLGDFPFTPFSKIVKGNSEPESKYPVAWSWLILLKIIASFAEDAGATHEDPIRFQRCVQALQEVGLAPTDDVASLVRQTSKSGFKIAIPTIGDFEKSGEKSGGAADIAAYVDSLKEIVFNISGNSQHYLVIDGLDDVLTKREAQYVALGALFYEVARLNESFLSNSVPAKIILLCRTDLFEKVSNANKNKTRQDSAVQLDWYHDPGNPGNSLLIRAANKRAALALGGDIDIFDKFFPRAIKGSDTRTFLLDHTRHTPRDFLQLMKKIQECADDDKVLPNHVRNGVRLYSLDYFMPEIRDELDGYASTEEIESLIAAISSLRNREFSYKDYLAATESHGIPYDRSQELLQNLFSCSAVGNIQHRPTGSVFYTFKFRNRNSTLTRAEPILLHKGLWKAFNLV